MDFVWVYVARESSYYKCGLFNELEYSIKSVRKFYQGEVRCFVIGDDPRLNSLDVIHIDSPRTWETKQPRHIDMMIKFEKIWDSDIGDEFVLMYDDVYLLQPTTKADLQIVYGKAEVDDPVEYVKIRTGTPPYKEYWLSTYDYIKMDRDLRGMKTYDWETHLPRLYNKEKIKGIVDKFNLRNVPRLPYSLYASTYAEETIIMPDDLQSDLWTHRPGMDFDVEFSKKYMNIYDNVIIPEFILKMKNHMA